MPPASPLAQRRDSILKHQNSVKTDKRVSIKSGSSKLQMTSNLEYISEKPSSLSSSASTLPSSGSTTLERRPSKTTGPRPASLVITKQDNKGSQFKLVRSSSVDYEDIESQMPTARSVNKIILAEHLPEDESAPLVFTVHK